MSAQLTLGRLALPTALYLHLEVAAHWQLTRDALRVAFDFLTAHDGTLGRSTRLFLTSHGVRSGGEKFIRSIGEGFTPASCIYCPIKNPHLNGGSIPFSAKRLERRDNESHRLSIVDGGCRQALCECLPS